MLCFFISHAEVVGLCRRCLRAVAVSGWASTQRCFVRPQKRSPRCFWLFSFFFFFPMCFTCVHSTSGCLDWCHHTPVDSLPQPTALSSAVSVFSIETPQTTGALLRHRHAIHYSQTCNCHHACAPKLCFPASVLLFVCTHQHTPPHVAVCCSLLHHSSATWEIVLSAKTGAGAEQSNKKSKMQKNTPFCWRNSTPLHTTVCEHVFQCFLVAFDDVFSIVHTFCPAVTTTLIVYMTTTPMPTPHPTL